MPLFDFVVSQTLPMNVCHLLWHLITSYGTENSKFKLYLNFGHMQFWVQDIDRPWVHPFITNWDFNLRNCNTSNPMSGCFRTQMLTAPVTLCFKYLVTSWYRNLSQIELYNLKNCCSTSSFIHWCFGNLKLEPVCSDLSMKWHNYVGIYQKLGFLTSRTFVVLIAPCTGICFWNLKFMEPLFCFSSSVVQ